MAPNEVSLAGYKILSDTYDSAAEPLPATGNLVTPQENSNSIPWRHSTPQGLHQTT